MITEPVIRPIETPSAAGRVAVELRRSIVSGALAPGRTFSLREVAAQLGVSFIPVREALRNLENEGLVASHPGRSTTVAPLDLATCGRSTGCAAPWSQRSPNAPACCCQTPNSTD